MQKYTHPLRFASQGPKSVKLLGQNLVVWKDSVMPDRCSHRNAKLSQGRVVMGHLECSYHGWRFDERGTCVAIPQLPDPYKIPKACNMQVVPSVTHDGIIWAGEAPLHDGILNNAWSTDENYLVTDYELESPCNYFLQVENLLDPAHLHFVHDGFQGNRKKAGPIKTRLLSNTDDLIEASFTHSGDVPEIVIRFLPPSVVDVSILNREGKVSRKNIIYVSPASDVSCNVMFRDVLVKKHSMPSLIQAHLNLIVPKASYDTLNNSIITEIVKQDIDVLKGQQENFYNRRYVMPSESDMLIILFRRWCEKHVSKTN